MLIKFENKHGCLEAGRGFGCIDFFVPEACDKRRCKEQDDCAAKLLIETPRAGIQLVMVGGKAEGEIRLRC